MPNTEITWKEHVTRRLAGEDGYPIVEVIWDDALSKAVTNWEEKVTNDVAVVTSVGYLIYEDDEVITIISLINQDQIGHGITIPRVLVYENGIRYL